MELSYASAGRNMTELIREPDYDIPMRNIFRKGGGHFLRQLGLERGQLLDTDVSVVRKRNVDYAALVKPGEIHHVEFQRGEDKSMPVRMLDYFGSILRIYTEPDSDRFPMVRQVVAEVANVMPSGMTTTDFGAATHSYCTRNTLVLDGDALIADGDTGDVVLSVLCGLKDEHEGIRRALEKIQGTPRRKRMDYLNWYMSLSVATSRWDRALHILENEVSLKIRASELPIVVQMNREWKRSEIIGSIIEFCRERFGRELGEQERLQLEQLGTEDASALRLELYRADSPDPVIAERLGSSTSPRV